MDLPVTKVQRGALTRRRQLDCSTWSLPTWVRADQQDDRIKADLSRLRTAVSIHRSQRKEGRHSVVWPHGHATWHPATQRWPALPRHGTCRNRTGTEPFAATAALCSSSPCISDQHSFAYHRLFHTTGVRPVPDTN